MDLSHIFSLTNLPTGLVIALVIFIVYDKFFSKRAKEHIEADNNLNKIFKETIEALEKRIDNLSQELDKTNKELHTIKGEYDSIVKILQGKDEESIKYRERGTRIMDLVENELAPIIRKIK